MSVSEQISAPAPPSSLTNGLSPNIVEMTAPCEFCNKTVRLSDFVGGQDVETIADALDIHYIESCSMLMSCQACEKIIEKSRLQSHLVSECEHRDKIKDNGEYAILNTDVVAQK